MKRKKNFTLIILIAIILISIAVTLAAFFSRPIEVHEIDVLFEVVPRSIGVDLNNTALSFGRIYPGAVVTRTVSIYNNYDSPKNVRVLISKNLQDVLFSGKPEFDLASGDKEQIAFSLRIPEDFETGNYTGSVVFQFR